MSKILQFLTSPGSFMKALIIHEDVASTAEANAALQHSVQRAKNSLSGRATEMLHGATRNPEPQSFVLAGSILF